MNKLYKKCSYYLNNLNVRDNCIFDEITGVHSKKYFHKELYKERYRTQRFKRHLSMLIVTCLSKKTSKPPLKNKSIKEAALILASSIRTCDIIAKNSPNSFIILLPETDKTSTKAVVDRISCSLRKIYTLIYTYDIYNVSKHKKVGKFTNSLRHMSKEELQVLVQNLNAACITDDLTGLYNFRYLQKAMQLEVEEAMRQNTPLSTLMIDLDDFKKINDTRGHDEGNNVLKNVARVLKKNCRKTNKVIRYAGDEFVILLPRTTNCDAEILAERLRAQISEYVNIECSIGVSTLGLNDKFSKKLLMEADKKLYKEKNSKK